MDPLAQFKEAAKAGWSSFAPTEMITGSAAPRLVKHARIGKDAAVLDVGCGTGVVALTAARLGARVLGADLTPKLLERARENAAIMSLDVEWHEAPPPPPGVAPPIQWGDPAIVRERLGPAVRDIVFDRDAIVFQTLSPAHLRVFMETNVGPISRLVQSLASDPAKLASFRREMDELTGLYFEDNQVRQQYLLTRATKV